MEIKNKAEAKILIAENIKKPVERKLLIEKCVKNSDLTDEELRDKKPGGALNKTKCLLGLAITDMIKSGILVDADGVLSFKDYRNQNKPESEKDTVESVKRDILIEEIILELLKNEKYERSRLLDRICEKYRSSDPSQNDNVVKADAGRLLDLAVKNKKINIDENKLYFIASEPEDEDFTETNRRLFKELGDEELVNCTVEMLAKWYETVCGYKKIESENIDGPEDGGVDGIIQGEDKMGYSEKILIQVKKKNNKNKPVPLCEIREFAGVLVADRNANKGIFVTNGNYHVKTLAFVNTFNPKYYVLVDGNKWLELAKECKYKLQDNKV